MISSVQDDTQVLQKLVEQGNDERALHLVFDLLNTDEEKPKERIPLLLAIGDRYVALGLMHEDGVQDVQTVEALFARRCRKRWPSKERNSRAITWYEEARNNYQAVLKLNCKSQEETFIASHRLILIYILLGRYKRALHACSRTLSFAAGTVDQQAEIVFLRGIVYFQQGDQSTAHYTFSVAHHMSPHNEEYAAAQVRAQEWKP